MRLLGLIWDVKAETQAPWGAVAGGVSTFVYLIDVPQGHLSSAAGQRIRNET